MNLYLYLKKKKHMQKYSVYQKMLSVLTNSQVTVLNIGFVIKKC